MCCFSSDSSIMENKTNMKKLNEEEMYTLFNIIIVVSFLLLMFG